MSKRRLRIVDEQDGHCRGKDCHCNHFQESGEPLELKSLGGSTVSEQAFLEIFRTLDGKSGQELLSYFRRRALALEITEHLEQQGLLKNS